MPIQRIDIKTLSKFFFFKSSVFFFVEKEIWFKIKKANKHTTLSDKNNSDYKRKSNIHQQQDHLISIGVVKIVEF